MGYLVNNIDNIGRFDKNCTLRAINRFFVTFRKVKRALMFHLREILILIYKISIYNMEIFL